MRGRVKAERSGLDQPWEEINDITAASVEGMRYGFRFSDRQ